MAVYLTPNVLGEEITYPITFQGVTSQPATVGLKAYRNGDLIHITMNPADAVSNSTLFGFTLPFPAASGTKASFTVTAKNSNTITASGSRAEVQDNSNFVILRTTHAATVASWTATGNKTCYASFTYLANTANTKKVFIDSDSLGMNDDNAGTSRANGLQLFTTLQANLTGNKPRMFPVGVPGKTAAQLITDFPTKVLPYLSAGDIVIFWAGVNDIRGGANAATTAQRIKDYCTLVRNAGGIVINITPIPGQLSGDAAGVSAESLATAALLIADSTYCDYQVNPSLLTQFDAATDRTNTTFYCTDQLHLTAAGYALIEPLVRTVLQPLI
jgi:lysophospholipase L1-like esterase